MSKAKRQDQTAPDTSGSYRLDDQVGFILRRATQRHLTVFAERIQDLTPTQFATLAKLMELGPVPQIQLGRHTAMDAATVKGVIDRLSKRGYVTTRPDSEDLRRVIVAPSATGEALFQQYVAAAHDVTSVTLNPLTAAEQDIFLGLLRKLI